IFDAILNRAPVAPVRLNPALPAELERILNSSLEKDRDLRYQTAGALRSDLKRLKRDTSSSRVAVAAPRPASMPAASAEARPASSGSVLATEAKRHKFVVVGLGLVSLVVLAAAVLGIHSLLQRRTSAPFRNMAIANLTESGKANKVAIS